MMEKTYFIEEYKTNIPKKLDKWKVAFPEKVVERFINEYSKKGDVVFDPFAGFGTTLKAAKKLGRKAFGSEIDGEKAEFAKDKFKVDLIDISAFELDYSSIPEIDLCIFSPPYWGPALGAKTYEEYLAKLQKLTIKIRSRMKKGAHLVVFMQNYQTKGGLFTLAWDAGNALKKVFRLEQDVIWCIDRKKSKRDAAHEASDHHYCLVFRKE
jgi:tRNA G10  N-methylase Trm11